MRIWHGLVFCDFVVFDPAYSSDAFVCLFGRGDRLALSVRATLCTGHTTLEVALEASADSRNWATFATPVSRTVAIGTYQVFDVSVDTSTMPCFGRLKISWGGKISGHLSIRVAVRGRPRR